MIMYFLEVAVNANVEDILVFLEKDNQLIPSRIYPSERPNGLDLIVNFHTQRESNAISIYTTGYTLRPKTSYPRCYEDDPDGPGNEVIRFELIRLTDIRSLIKGSYQADNSDI